MTTLMSVTELLSNPMSLVDRVLHGNETVVLTHQSLAVAEVRPLSPQVSAGMTMADILRSLPRLAPRDAEVFAKDIENARNELAQIPRREWN